MTVTALLPVRVWKEVRGLSPAWLACLASMAIAAGLGGRMRFAGLAAYFLGAVALGGLSMGHEFTSRTLTLLLSQPARRERLFLEKLGVLAVMLLALFTVAWLGLFDPAVPSSNWGLDARWTRDWWTVAFGLPVLCGLVVAPLLTMVCRSSLAGIVFAVTVPATIWMASDFTSALIYRGELAAEASGFTFEMFWRGMLIVCLLAAVASWRTFMRLEAIDGRGLEVRLPAWLAGRTGPVAAAPAFARRHAMWLLAKKELRLQQLTFAVSGLYVLGWIAILWFNQVTPPQRVTLLFASTIFHSGTIALLAGALASAEERQLGTLEWQVLLPMAGWKQWLLKTSIALGVALTLSLGLPALLLYFNATPEIRSEVGRLISPTISYFVIPLVVIGLYVSSVSVNGMRALLMSVPAVFLVGLVITGFARVYDRWYPVSWRHWFQVYRSGLLSTDELLYTALLNLLVIVMYVGVLGVLLRFALTNHRSAERGTGRVWKQMLRLIAVLAIGTALWSGTYRLYGASMDERHRVMNLNFLTVTGVTMDGAYNLVKEYTVAIFPEDQSPEAKERWQGRRRFFVLANSQGEFRFYGLRPGRYFFVAVEKLEREAQRDPELIDRLEALAIPVTLEAGHSKVLSLMLTEF